MVNVRCHLFNASDRPIGGFVRHVARHDHRGASAPAPTAVQRTGFAPGYHGDLARTSRRFARADAQ